MAPTTFAAALLIFANLWLIALVSFAVIALSVFLYVLGAVGAIVGPSLAISLICSACSFIYLALQCINVSDTTHRRWHRSWLSSTCVHLPRVLIVLWIIATSVGLVIVFRQPFSQNNNIGQDATAWRTAIGCWIFRALVSLDAVMLVLSFTLFCLLEVNGRYIALALFHFEYMPASTSARRRRRNLIASPYGTSVETLSSPMTINSEDELQLMHEKRDSQPRSLSPSPTYHTFDSVKTNAMIWPGSRSTSGRLTRDESRDGFLHEHPIPIDLTFHGSLPTRRSIAFAATSAKNDTADASTSTIFSGAQLQSRPISDVPDVPSKTRSSFYDLKHITVPLVTAPIAARAMSDQKAFTYSTPHSFAVNMVNPTTRFKSTCGLPCESATRAHSMVDLSSYSTTATISDPKAEPSTNLVTSTSTVTNVHTNNGHTPYPSTDTTGRFSTASLPEHPLPAWCPQTLRSAPLSADPAIRRLTELQSRSRSSMIRKSRMGAGKKRGSFGAFEFGFGVSGRRSAMSTAETPTISSARGGDIVDDMNVDLSDFPATPTPLTRKRTEDSRKKEKEKEVCSSTGFMNKENFASGDTTAITNETVKKTSMNVNEPAPALKTTTPKRDKVANRNRARKATVTSTSTKGFYSIMPPAASRQGEDSVSSSALGLGIEGINVTRIAIAPNAIAEGNDDRGVKRQREKKIVERGRYEKLPR